MEGLRLVLGVGRSGTTWLVKILSQVDTPLRVIQEPLPIIRSIARGLPRSVLNKDIYTHPLGRCNYLPDTHSVILTYNKCISAKRFKSEKHRPNKRVIKNVKDWKYLMIKEVNCLLATEALLNRYENTKVIFIVRDPVYIVDSLFSAQGWDSSKEVYLNQESLYFDINTDFIEDERLSVFAKKIQTIECMHTVFESVKEKYNDCVNIIKYEDLCKDPLSMFKSLAKFFDFEWGKKAEDFLSITLTPGDSNSQNNPYSIQRNTSNQVTRRFRYLSEKEVDFCYEFLYNLKGKEK